MGCSTKISSTTERPLVNIILSTLPGSGTRQYEVYEAGKIRIHDNNKVKTLSISASELEPLKLQIQNAYLELKRTTKVDGVYGGFNIDIFYNSNEKVGLFGYVQSYYKLVETPKMLQMLDAISPRSSANP